MILAITMGVIGHLCASFITIFGGYAILQVLQPEGSVNLGVLLAAVLFFALVRGFLRYAEQACNHFIAFKLLEMCIRDRLLHRLQRKELLSSGRAVRKSIWRREEQGQGKLSHSS